MCCPLSFFNLQPQDKRQKSDGNFVWNLLCQGYFKSLHRKNYWAKNLVLWIFSNDIFVSDKFVFFVSYLYIWKHQDLYACRVKNLMLMLFCLLSRGGWLKKKTRQHISYCFGILFGKGPYVWVGWLGWLG